MRLRLVAALADSIFQSELIMSDANFLRLFPGRRATGCCWSRRRRRAGRAGRQRNRRGRAAISARTRCSTVERLAEFHRVENTYISTFQTLGGLGLLVGTVGLAAVLLRNVLERRRELALLGAVGYRAGHVFAIVLAENVLLLGWGLAIGTACALVAVSPACAERGRLAAGGGGAWCLLVAVFVSRAGIVDRSRRGPRCARRCSAR